MEAKPFRVVRQGETYSVQSTKAEGGQIQKCNIVLRELGISGTRKRSTGISRYLDYRHRETE